MTVVRLAPGHPQFADAVELFDQYRQHYGANPAPEAVEAWMREQMAAERMRLYGAGHGDRLRAICTVAVIPASLTLRTVWLVRDLFVEPDSRRGGLGRALLGQIADEARAEGAHRLSLQTEADNERALALYERAGFSAVTDIAVLNRVL